MVDPADLHLTVFELRDGADALVADITEDDTWTPTTPYGVTITPRELRY